MEKEKMNENEYSEKWLIKRAVKQLIILEKI
jgi:hypothetical protein